MFLRFSRHLFTMSVVAGILGLGIILMLLQGAMDEASHNDSQRTAALHLNDELRTTARMLSNLARLAISNGDEDAAASFRERLSILQGKAPRPANYLVAPARTAEFPVLVEALTLPEEENSMLLQAYQLVLDNAMVEQAALDLAATKNSSREQVLNLVLGERYLNQNLEIGKKFAELSLHLLQRLDAANQTIYDRMSYLLLGVCVVFFYTLVSLIITGFMLTRFAKTRTRTLRSFIYILLILCLALAGPIWFIYADARESAITALEKRQSLICGEVYRELQMRIRQSTEVTQLIAARPPVFLYADAVTRGRGSAEEHEAAVEVLRTFSQGYADSMDSLLLGRDGRMLAEPGRLLLPVDRALLGPEDMGAVLNGKSVIRSIYINHEPELIIAVPVFSQGLAGGGTVGVVVSFLDKRNSLNLWEGRLAPEENMNIFVLDRNGGVIMSSQGEGWQAQTMLHEDTGLLALNQMEGLRYFTDKEDVRRIGYFMRMKDIDWTVGVTSSYSSMTATVRGIWVRASLFAAISILMAIVLFSLLVRQLTRSLQASNERMEGIIEGAGMGTWDYDVPAGVFSHNAQWGRLTGETAEEGTLPMSWMYDHVHPDDSYMLERLRGSFTVGALLDFELRMRMPSGEWRWFQNLGRVDECDSTGRARRIVGTVFDIHARKMEEISDEEQKRQLEALVAQRTAELEESRNQAVAASQAKTSFLSTVSHEIRTPMNAIVGFVHLFERQNLDQKQVDYLNKIRLAADTLLNIINDVLDISKIEAGKLELERAPFHIQTLLDTVCSIVGFAVRDKGLYIRVHIEPDVPHTLMGDPKRITQILLNLANNAAKFTSRGGIDIRVRVKENLPPAQDGGPERVLLGVSVEDTGVGLSPEQQERLFKPFSQADSSISRKFGGTGLGLAISKHLTELMGGSIGVTSEPGKGSTFSFTMNLDRALESESPVKVVRDAMAEESLTENIRGLKVLVVEDNAINQEIAAAMLESLGVEVTLADNGQEGIDKAALRPYDIIFMDMQMPVMDGIAASLRIREMGRAADSPVPWLAEVPIVAMTANAMAEDRQRCLEAGMDDHMPKPFEPQMLHAKLLQWGKHRHSLTFQQH